MSRAGSSPTGSVTVLTAGGRVQHQSHVKIAGLGRGDAEVLGRHAASSSLSLGFGPVLCRRRGCEVPLTVDHVTPVPVEGL